MPEVNSEIKNYIDRIERLNEDKSAVSSDIKDVYQEAKGRGFDIKALRQVIRLRKMSPAERRATEDVIETYMVALGMK